MADQEAYIVIVFQGNTRIDGSIADQEYTRLIADLEAGDGGPQVATYTLREVDRKQYPYIINLRAVAYITRRPAAGK